MTMKFAYFFIGTTSEFIKIAPILKELKKRKIPFKIISAGQTKIHFEDLRGYVGEIKADIVLKEKLNKASVLHFMYWAIRTLITAPFMLYKEFKGKTKANTYFIIFGDPVASTIGAIIARLFNLTLVHIESGDLSFDLFEPFPEEFCRNINIRLADILFAPTDWALNNLKSLKSLKISTKENTIFECCLWAINKLKKPTIINKLGKYYILIMHRQEHVVFRKDWAKKTLKLIIKNANKKLNCVIFEHALSTKIVQSLVPSLEKRLKDKIISIPQVPYSDFIKLLQYSEFVATDGASNQQEVYYLGKPCLSLRDKTEQIEGLDKNVILYKSDTEIAKKFLQNYKQYKTKPISAYVSPSKIVVYHLFGN